MGLTTERTQGNQPSIILPREIETEVQRKVTDRPDVDLDRSQEGGGQPRYIVVVEKPAPKGPSFWGRIGKTIAALAVAAAIAATAYIGINGMNQGGPLDQTPVAPIEKVEPNAPVLPAPVTPDTAPTAPTIMPNAPSLPGR